MDGSAPGTAGLLQWNVLGEYDTDVAWVSEMEALVLWFNGGWTVVGLWFVV